MIYFERFFILSVVLIAAAEFCLGAFAARKGKSWPIKPVTTGGQKNDAIANAGKNEAKGFK
jgi:hypothetical protein